MRDFNIQKQPKPVRDANFWRYQKKTAPVDENPELNGPVKIIKRFVPLPLEEEKKLKGNKRATYFHKKHPNIKKEQK